MKRSGGNFENSSDKKKQLNTPINEEILEAFKKKCKELKIPMNEALTTFMLEVINGEVEMSNCVKLKRK